MVDPVLYSFLAFFLQPLLFLTLVFTLQAQFLGVLSLLVLDNFLTLQLLMLFKPFVVTPGFFLLNEKLSPTVVLILFLVLQAEFFQLGLEKIVLLHDSRIKWGFLLSGLSENDSGKLIAQLLDLRLCF